MLKTILTKTWQGIEVVAAIIATYILVCIAFAW